MSGSLDGEPEPPADCVFEAIHVEQAGARDRVRKIWSFAGQDTEVVNARHESVSLLDVTALKGFPNALVGIGSDVNGLACSISGHEAVVL